MVLPLKRSTRNRFLHQINASVYSPNTSLCRIWYLEDSSWCLRTLTPHAVSQSSPHISEYQATCSPDGSPTPAHSSSCWRQNCQRISPRSSGLWAGRVKDWKQMDSTSETRNIEKTHVRLGNVPQEPRGFVRVPGARTTVKEGHADVTQVTRGGGTGVISLRVEDTPIAWSGGRCLCQRRWRWTWGSREWTPASDSTSDSGISGTRRCWPDSEAC